MERTSANGATVRDDRQSLLPGGLSPSWRRRAASDRHCVHRIEDKRLVPAHQNVVDVKIAMNARVFDWLLMHIMNSRFRSLNRSLTTSRAPS